MTDRRDNEHLAPGVFDDDRVLAYALGLDDDPELAAAAAGETALAARVAAMREDVSRVGACVDAAVAAPADDYADLADPRWSGLRDYLQEPATPARRRGSRWLRVLAPVAAVAAALAVGLTLIDGSGQDATQLGEKSGGSEAAPAVTRDATVASYAEQVDQFATVVLARARAASGAIQSFVVVKLLKGYSPDVLRLRIADGPADTGRLHLLFLGPLRESAGIGEEGDDASSATSSPLPSPASPADVTAYLAGDPVVYVYQGHTALARELPTGIDPESIALP